ncbi:MULTISPECIES: hypothetical protein [Mesonia]|uniref:Uncharacterized protein n=1 Tax=Mesonia oceanica TaxID=2687242 RepID=A0AC61Y4E6_9FLAO|nr:MULTISPECIES: hypothetical protein [Mesonia]VVU99355.1 hypothetical protein FVB9532_00607 [Mesonia oceanica]|tara:strand:+ start:150 stop:299 length:150 start_codon:yes stop_codon:yes gene_type:complete
MSENRRKNKSRKDIKTSNNTITKKDKIYGILAMVIIFITALIAAIFVSF